MQRETGFLEVSIFEHVENASLDAEAKGFVFDSLDAPISIGEVAAIATSPEQAPEVYLVSRLVTDPDESSERAYLQALAPASNWRPNS